MDLRQLEYVVTVAELGSFTRAAERCHVVQSALSHQVARLERELGARLFHRTSRQVRLTDAGASFLPSARQCLAAADRARAEVAATTGVVRGTLSIGVISTVAAVDVPAALRRFRDLHPQVRASLVVSGSDDLIDRVSTGLLDLAFLGLLADTSITGVQDRVVARDELAVVVAPAHPLVAVSPLRLADLVEHAFVDFPSGTPGRAQSDQAFLAAGLTRDVAFEVSDASLMTRLISEQLGIGMLPAAYAAQLTGIVSLRVVDAPTRDEHLVWSIDGPTPATAAFLEQLGLEQLD